MMFAQVFNVTPAGPNRYAQALEAFRNQLADTPTNTLREKNTDAISPVERFSIFATGNYDIGANQELYGEVLLNRRESHQDDWQQLFPTFVASAADPNNPFPGQIADSTVLVPSDSDQEIDYWRAIFGVRGDLPFIPGWRYDVYGQFGRSEGELSDDGTLRDRLLDALGYRVSDGAVYLGPCTQNVAANCAPFNMFDINYIQTGVLPEAVANYIRTVDVGHTTYEQTLFQAVIDGDVMQLPAGALALALGAEWREESIDDTPSVDTQNNNVFQRTSAGRTVGTDTVYEFFGEAEIPLISNAPLFEQLTFNTSARWTHYDSYGENSTYKLGLNWSLTPEYRLRSTFGTSYRAPALFELFLADQTSFLGQAQIDPCIDWGNDPDPILQQRCAADGIPPDYPGTAVSATIFTGGGAGILEAEESEALSVGFIWTPSFVDLSVALDYFEIEVNDQVAQFGVANILNACYRGVSDDFCTLFTRQLNPALPNFLGIATVDNSFVNLDQQITRGLDLAARYEHEFSFGTFRADLDITWTFEDAFNLFSGELVDFNGEVGDPDFVGNLALRFDRGDWTYFWDIDMIGKASDTEDVGGDVFVFRQGAVTGFPAVPNYFKQYTEATAYHDASVRYQTDAWTFQFGIQNVFGEEPPAVSTGVTRIGNVQLVATQNDLLGRRAFFEVTRRW
jgi:iron complex outermembrane receptor protein